MSNWSTKSRRVVAIYGVVIAALFTALSLASVVYDELTIPMKGRWGNSSEDVDFLLLLGYVLVSLIAITIASATTLSGQRLAVQAYRIIVALLAASALWEAFRLVYINHLPDIECILLPASIGAVAVSVYFRSLSDKQNARVG